MTLADDKPSRQEDRNGNVPEADDVERDPLIKNHVTNETFKENNAEKDESLRETDVAIEFVALKPIEPKESQTRNGKSKLRKNGTADDTDVKKESKVLLEIEESQKDSWSPDGGWGWAIVIGGVIAHVYVGT